MKTIQKITKNEEKASGRMLNEQELWFFNESKHICESTVSSLIEERKAKRQALQERDIYKKQADDYAERLRKSELEKERILAAYRMMQSSAVHFLKDYFPNEEKTVLPVESEGNIPSVEERIKEAIATMQDERLFRYGYDYVWLMLAMNQNRDLPSFDSISSFRDFLVRIGINDLPSTSNFLKKSATARRQHPSWTFTDTSDLNETRRRNNLASRFLSLMRKG